MERRLHLSMDKQDVTNMLFRALRCISPSFAGAPLFIFLPHLAEMITLCVHVFLDGPVS